ncbi:MAG: ABC transporter permease [Chitinophagaceae bacterium]
MHQLRSIQRSLARNKVFSAINIAGLAIGISVFLLIAEFIASEWGANRFHKNYDRLYRAASVTKENTNYYLPPGYSAILKQKFPQIEAATRLTENMGNGVITYTTSSGELKTFREEKILYADGDFLEVFSFPLVSGMPSIEAPNTLALTSSISKKLFGNDDPVGKTVTVSNQFGNTIYTINAVIKDITESSDISGEVFLSLNTLASAANRDGNDWADPNTLESGFVFIYPLLKEGANADLLQKEVTNFLHSSNPDLKDVSFAIQPFKHLHLAPGFNYPFQTFGSLTLVTMLLAVAVLILFIAWINYINLSTVQALKRAKEAGIRKVLGATRGQLARRFLSETFALTLLSVLLAILIVQILQPLFNRFTGKNLSLITLNQGWFWPAAILLILAGSFLSGGYVSFILSSFKPVETIRGKLDKQPRGISLRKGLVVFQFSISIVFIIATIVLYKQLSFMKTESLGMNIDQLLVIAGPTVSSEGQAEKNFTFKNQLKTLPFVQKVAASNNVPGRGYNFSTQDITRQNPQPGDEKKTYSMFISDEMFFDTYGISFIEGKTYTEDQALSGWSNAGKVIINQKAASQLGFTAGQPIVGKKIVWGKEYEVIGVVKDYHHLSLHQAIDPIIYLPSVSFSYFTIKTEASNMPAKISQIKEMYKSIFPGNPYDYFFADESFDQQYKKEQDLGNLFIAAALIAIFIACLGLFGLAAFSAQQRIKEIGIRKVLGASVTDITGLLSKDFLVLVIVAIVIASPVAWWAMNKWLQDFAYRTNIDWWVFVIAGFAAVFIALLTVGTQAIKAAISNPVKSLRTE